MSAAFTLYAAVTVIGFIGMIIRGYMARQHGPERLRAVIVLPALSCCIGILYAYLLAEKAFAGFVWLLQFGFLSDLLMYFVGLNILVTALSLPAIPWLLSSAVARARLWGGAFCLCAALWFPFCLVFAAAPTR